MFWEHNRARHVAAPPLFSYWGTELVESHRCAVFSNGVCVLGAFKCLRQQPSAAHLRRGAPPSRSLDAAQETVQQSHLAVPLEVTTVLAKQRTNVS